MNVRTACSLLAATLLLGLAPAAALADTGLVVGAGVGTTGYGASLGYVLPFGIVVRAETGAFTYNPNFNANGDPYTGHLKLSNVLADVELHPLSKAFYVAGGGFFNGNSITASTTSAGVTIGGTNYGAGTANAKVTWQNVAPYVGFGFAPVHGGLGFDLGAAFQGSARAVVTSNIAGVTAADYASAQTQVQNAVNGFKVYPVVSLRYTFGF
jgi:hypothetical protein